MSLLDLALEKDYVRGKVAEYMNKLIDIGVAGFRVDACKHMWPGDLSNVYGRLKSLNTTWFLPGTKPFIYQEVSPSHPDQSYLKWLLKALTHFFFQVIDLGGEAIKASEYFDLGRVTEFKYSAKLGKVIRKWDKEKLSYLKYATVTSIITMLCGKFDSDWSITTLSAHIFLYIFTVVHGNIPVLF